MNKIIFILLLTIISCSSTQNNFREAEIYSSEIISEEYIPSGVYVKEALNTPIQFKTQGMLNYPYEMKIRKISGKVIIGVVINKDGIMISHKTIYATNLLFEKAALDALFNSTFNSGELNGIRVDSYQKVNLQFSM